MSRCFLLGAQDVYTRELCNRGVGCVCVCVRVFLYMYLRVYAFVCTCMCNVYATLYRYIIIYNMNNTKDTTRPLPITRRPSTCYIGILRLANTAMNSDNAIIRPHSTRRRGAHRQKFRILTPMCKSAYRVVVSTHQFYCLRAIREKGKK